MSAVLRGEIVPVFHYSLVVVGPLVVLGFAGVYALRAARLLVMYNPHMRERWGKPLKQHEVIKILVALFALVEIVAWSATTVSGLRR